MAEIYGLCHICGKVAGQTCKLCGRSVCDKHYDAKMRVCTTCKGGRMLKSSSKK